MKKSCNRWGRGHLAVASVIVMSIGGTSCVVATDENASEALGENSEALMTETAVWSQGNAPVALGSAADRFCFLTYIGGDFEGGGESVHVRISNGQWQLTGTSAQSGVQGRARCQLGVPAAEQTGEFAWAQGQAEVNLGPTASRACFLTRVAGDFEGGGEAVWVRKLNGSYLLGGSSQQAGVQARARCALNRTTFLNDWTWSQGSGATIMVQALQENNGWACGLTRMKGRFEGGGERIFVGWNGNQRYLSGASGQVSVAANANCF